MTTSGASAQGMARETSIAGFTVREFRQPANRTLASHEHAEASIGLVLAGSYVERIRGVDRECAAGTVVLKPPHERHADQFGTEGGHCLLVELSAERLHQVEPYTTIAREPHVIHEARMLETGRRLQRELRGVDALSPLAIEAMVLELLVHTTRAHGRSQDTAPSWLALAEEFIRDTVHGPISLTAVAAVAGVHPAHLARTFRRHHGVSLGVFVRRLRVERAASALAASDSPLSRIALDAGFYDQSHFTRIFVRQTGMTPSTYRASLGRR